MTCSAEPVPNATGSGRLARLCRLEHRNRGRFIGVFHILRLPRLILLRRARCVLGFPRFLRKQGCTPNPHGLPGPSAHQPEYRVGLPRCRCQGVNFRLCGTTGTERLRQSFSFVLTLLGTAYCELGDAKAKDAGRDRSSQRVLFRPSAYVHALDE